MPETIQLSHPRLGLCQRVAVEGTDWIVLVAASGKRYRVPSFKRGEFVLVRPPADIPEAISQPVPLGRVLLKPGAVPQDAPVVQMHPPPAQVPEPPHVEAPGNGV